MFNAVPADSLIWFPEKRMGYFPVKAFTYDSAYFDKYMGYAETEVGRQITKARIDLVARHHVGPVVDVGIGCGQFVGLRPDTRGFDVNLEAERWLKDRGLWSDIYVGQGLGALTFWDSLEHIEDIESAVSCAKRFVFVSIPIFSGPDHVLRSKHFRKDEHYWYFTDSGLIWWFGERGFDLLESNKMEQEFGREDIGSYAFKRRNG